MPLYHTIQPLILELMNRKGYLSQDYMTGLFPRLHEATKEMPFCMPVLMIGYNGYYFISPYNTIRGNKYVICKGEGMELAQTLMDCIYIKCFNAERQNYLRGVMPFVIKNLKLTPSIEHDVKLSYVTGEAHICIQFMEDKDLFTSAVNHEGGVLLSMELPAEGSAPRVYAEAS